jgi:bacteriocin-like protein
MERDRQPQDETIVAAGTPPAGELSDEELAQVTGGVKIAAYAAAVPPEPAEGT